MQIEFAAHSAEHLTGMLWSAAADSMPKIVGDYLEARFPESARHSLDELTAAHVSVSERNIRIDFDAIAAALHH